MMETRDVIPPSTGVSDPRHHEETLGVLKGRLCSVEQDTKGLVSQLTQMGLSASGSHQGDRTPGNACPPLGAGVRRAVTGSGTGSDSHLLAASYEQLVSRVCRTESTVQTLKLSLTRVQAEVELSRGQKEAVSERMLNTSEAYEKEVSRLSRELVTGRKELKESQEDRRKAIEELGQLRQMADTTAAEKSASTMLIEDLKAAKAKLLRRVNELREDGVREALLRSSLEESHATLIKRLEDMEGVASTEQEEVKKLNACCSQLKRSAICAREEANHERALRLQAEEKLKQISSQSDISQSELEVLRADKTYLMSEMDKLRKRYQDLIAQLDQTHKLVSDKQSTHGQLEKENKRLYEAMKAAAAQNAKLIAQYEEELEKFRSDAAGKTQGEQHIRELSDQLRLESREKGQALMSSSRMEVRIGELEDKLKRMEKDLKERSEHHRAEVADLRETVRVKEEEKDRMLRDKDTLLDEVNSALDQAVEERGQLQAQLKQCEMDLQNAALNRTQMEQEMTRLLERLVALEDQVATTGQVEQGLNRMQEQKNQLAYDKGRLQSRVEELQREVQTLANSQSELVQLRKVTATLEVNYKKSQTELNNSRLMVQRLESEKRHVATSGVRKDEDFQLAIASRDEALKEGKRLVEHIETLEDRERHRLFGLERSLGDTRQDNKKVAATLNSIMMSHAQLQLTVEGLQLELGRRDAQISQITADKTKAEHKARQLEKELENLQSKLISYGTREATELDPLQATLELCKTDNVKMANSLETVVRSNGMLQASVEMLTDEVEKKTFLLEQTKAAREKDASKHEASLKAVEERTEKLKEQSNHDREKTAKRVSKEVTEVRHQLDELLNKNGELSRANTDLRRKITELENENSEQKKKILKQNGQIKHLSRMKDKQAVAMNSMQSVSDQLIGLEKSNLEYVRKNDKQAKLIEKFMAQMGSIQEELQGVAQTQSDMAKMMQTQEEQLRTERTNYDELRHKYKLSRKRESELAALKRLTEQQLLKAGNESMEVSASLTCAQSWFKTKFDTLQNELTKSRSDRENRFVTYIATDLTDGLQRDLMQARKSQAGLVTENFEQKLMLEDERKKAQDTAESARQMIKASRETISRLADYAEVAQEETRTQMQGMRSQLESEQDYTRAAEASYHDLRESSLRHTEQLAKELEQLRSSYRPYTSSLDTT